MALNFGFILLVCGQLAFYASADIGDLVRNRTQAHLIACPVLAGLYSRGLLEPDSYGRVSERQLQHALQETGISVGFAAFQSIGIAGYRGDDFHQNVRRATGPSAVFDRLHVNIFTMNPGDDCAVVGERTPSGFPCNANSQFLQHGYSTTMRDTRYDQEDPDRQKRFDFFIGSELVEPSSAGDEVNKATKERVLLFDGFKRMLLKSRSKGDSPMLSGDFSSEYSLTPEGEHKGSGLEKYHPSITDATKYHTLASWQPMLAWNGWWAAFCREAGEACYFTESDLRGFFIHGEFPEDWAKKRWGFQENFESIVALEPNREGESGLGTKFINAVKGMMLPDNACFTEVRYNGKMLSLLVSMGMLKDSVHNTWRAPQEGRTSEAASDLIV